MLLLVEVAWSSHALRTNLVTRAILNSTKIMIMMHLLTAVGVRTVAGMFSIVTKNFKCLRTLSEQSQL